MTKYLITSALPYINGIKHLGNLVGSMLPGDVYARFLRQKGEDVLYVCATDEHGTPAEIAALEKKQDVETFCAEQHQVQADIYRRFNLSFDYFGRSSSEENRVLTQHMAEKLAENGYIKEKTIQQIYSKADGRFLPDRYVVGKCPHCGYEAARGDQCEHCTRVLDPTDLINPKSAISGSSDLEARDTKHLFLMLPELKDKIEAFIDGKEGVFPPLVTSIARKWLKEGLHERCITRDLKWGVPVGKPGFEGKVFYVWFDAPIEYIAATQEWAGKDKGLDWKKYWYEADKDVKYVQFMGKDNIPFHTIMFPATLLGTGEPWKKADYIKGFNWLNFYGGKFSTSSKRGIFSDQALREFPADYWRYFLMANVPESSDFSFTFDAFAGAVNKDLNDVLGNFINRVLKMTASHFGNSVPGPMPSGEAEAALEKNLTALVKEYETSLEAMEFRKAMTALRAIWVEGNNYFATAAPWTVVKTDKKKGGAILNVAINLIRLYANLTYPVMPDMAGKMLDLLNIEAGGIPAFPGKIDGELTAVQEGATFKTPEVPLFSKILPERVQELCGTYGAPKE